MRVARAGAAPAQKPTPASSAARAPGWLVPAATALALALGIALRVAALQTPLHSDDYQQLAMLHGRFLLERAPWDLFWFGPDTPAERSALLDFGFEPWWTASGHRIAMLRPLSSLLIAFDDRVFGSDALLCHLHSFAWWALLVACAARLYARLLPAAVAACATVFFALDAGHNVPLSWLANRSTLVSAAFGMLALTAHVRARTDAAPRARVLAVLWWACAFAAGEYAFGMLAYLVAYEAVGAHGALRQRVVAALPALGIAALYLGLRTALGYGVAESALYVDPSQPLRLLLEAATRVPALAADLLLGVPASWWSIGSGLRNDLLNLGLIGQESWSKLPDGRGVQIALGCAALALAAYALARVARAPAADARSTAAIHALRWLGAGSLLALIGASGALPSARLLAAAAFGASALLAGALVHALRVLRAPAAHSVRARALALIAALAIALVHGALSAQAARAATVRTRLQAQTSQPWALRAPIPHAASDVDVVLISVSDFTTAVNVPWLRAWHGLSLPRSYRRLSGAQQAHDVVRVDAHTIDLSVLSHDVTDSCAGSLYRTRRDLLRTGDRVRVPGLEVTVLETNAGNPQRLRARFDRALDDPRLLFLHARPEGLTRIAIPPVGERLRLPRAAEPWLASTLRAP